MAERPYTQLKGTYTSICFTTPYIAEVNIINDINDFRRYISSSLVYIRTVPYVS